MAVRNQSKDDKHQYASPTTPGLYVTFRNYIIELVCLNTNPRISARFWSDKKYWAPKYKREIRGISNLNKSLDFTDIITRTALIQIIKEYNIKALVSKKTINKVIRLTNIRIGQLNEQRTTLAQKSPHKEIDQKKNATFVDTGEKNVLTKLREAENG